LDIIAFNEACMIRSLILYFLSVKDTHGYEIQKYIQLNHLDRWTKIQSGSIYHALAKLEAEGAIDCVSVERVGGRSRNIYRITEHGRDVLSNELLYELSAPINDIGGDKYLLYPLLGALDPSSAATVIGDHIVLLEERRAYLEHWQRVKRSMGFSRLEAMSFSMMLDGIAAQIEWHRVLLEELEACRAMGPGLESFIRKNDFSSLDESGIMQSVKAER